MRHASNSATRRFHRRTLLRTLLLLAAAGPQKALAALLRTGQSPPPAESADDAVRFGFASPPWRAARRAIQEGRIDAPRRLETDYSVAPRMGLEKGLFDALLPFVLVADLPLPWRVSTAGGHGGAGRPSGFDAPLSTIEYPGGRSVILSPTAPGRPPQPPIIRGRHMGLEILEHGIRFFPETDGSHAMMDPRRDIGFETCMESLGHVRHLASCAQATVAMILEARACGKAVYRGAGPARGMVAFRRV